MKLFPHEIKHLEMLGNISSECTLFLRREDDSFPLIDLKEIALYGNGIRHIVKGGTGSGNVNVRHYKNVEQVFEEHGIKITTKEWLDKYDELIKERDKEFVKRIKKEARENKTQAAAYAVGHLLEEGEYDFSISSDSEVAIYVLSRNAGEGKDRRLIKGDYYLTDTEIKTILELNKKHQKFLLVINATSQIDISPVLEVNNILLLSQLGSLTSETLFDIVMGNKYPSGKLASTWGNILDLSHFKEFGQRDDTNYIEGIYVGYRYYDSFNKKPIFEFGYGKSYAEFNITFLDISHNKDEITVKCKVKNIGNHVGKEVVQLYLRKPSNKFENVFQSLVAFKKSKELKPNEEEELELLFKLSDFPSFDESIDSYILNDGTYLLALGNSSRHLEVVASITLIEEAIIKKVKHIEANINFEEIKPNVNNKYSPLNNDIKLDVTSFIKNEIQYKPYKISLNPIAKELSNKELILLSLGDIKGGVKGLIGESCSKVLGGAGETCLKISKIKGCVSMCDGPAGIRVCQHYIESKGKKFKLVLDPIFEIVNKFLPKLITWILDDTGRNKKRKGEIKYQYCTAIPVATALAQSFNEEVIMTSGDIVREEMELYDVDIWLAPALNIHRHPLCGRNFEYYSEDPFLSGYYASVISKAIQKNPHKGVTIKHFACNNQETNRTNNSSNLSTRALREIYLFGFEKVIKEAAPAALMTSYNLINKVHSSECYDLINDILRCEMNYQGLVMTDWIQTGQIYNKGSVYPSASATKDILAGVNLCMPGGKPDIKDLNKSLKQGVISRDKLEENASIILDFIQKFSENIIE